MVSKGGGGTPLRPIYNACRILCYISGGTDKLNKTLHHVLFFAVFFLHENTDD